MDLVSTDYLRFVLALVFVLGLIGATALIAKRFGLGNRTPMLGRNSKRLALVETMSIDAKRRVVLLRRDGTEHLLLVGGASELVIESGIPTPSHTSQPTAVQA